MHATFRQDTKSRVSRRDGHQSWRGPRGSSRALPAHVLYTIRRTGAVRGIHFNTHTRAHQHTRYARTQTRARIHYYGVGEGGARVCVRSYIYLLPPTRSALFLNLEHVQGPAISLGRRRRRRRSRRSPLSRCRRIERSAVLQSLQEKKIHTTRTALQRGDLYVRVVYTHCTVRAPKISPRNIVPIHVYRDSCTCIDT